jgi:methionyl-tRNA formyltransferase
VSALRTVFGGTPQFAVPALQALIASGHSPMAVLCQPDRPAGRGRRLRVGPVKACALDAGIDVFQPPSLRDEAARAPLIELQPDLIVTAAYGLLLPPAVLALPRRGCWNLHASLLPRWRGASPINQAILAGDGETGITLMQMDAGLDTGPILMTASTPIGPEESAGELHDRLSLIAADLLRQALEAIVSGQPPTPQAQDNSRATHAPLIQRDDARLDWSRPAEALARQVRAYNPWPVAFGTVRGVELRVFEARVVEDLCGEPGALLQGQGDGEALIVACGQGALALREIQAAGRKRVSARDWLNGHPDWV